jgi:hypothetical protein
MKQARLRWMAAPTGSRWEVLSPSGEWVELEGVGRRSSLKDLQRRARAWARALRINEAKLLPVEIVSAPLKGNHRPPRTLRRAWPGSPLPGSPPSGVFECLFRGGVRVSFDFRNSVVTWRSASVWLHGNLFEIRGRRLPFTRWAIRLGPNGEVEPELLMEEEWRLRQN